MTPLEISLVVMVLMFLLGMPIFMGLIISAASALLFSDILPLSIIHNSLFDGLNLFPLLAIPCFVVAGSLMEYGNITHQIVDVVKLLVGRMHGGMGITDELAIGHYFKRATVIERSFGSENFHLARRGRLDG